MILIFWQIEDIPSERALMPSEQRSEEHLGDHTIEIIYRWSFCGVTAMSIVNVLQLLVAAKRVVIFKRNV